MRAVQRVGELWATGERGLGAGEEGGTQVRVGESGRNVNYGYYRKEGTLWTMETEDFVQFSSNGLCIEKSIPVSA